MLEELEKAKRTKFHETSALKALLTVEHVMPDNWSNHWPFADGRRPSSNESLQAVYSVVEDESLLGQTVRRNRLKHSIGNLTLLTQPMNSVQSNAGWVEKRALMQNPERGSLLVLNKEIDAVENWEETAIENRSAALFKLAIEIWPYPTES